MGNEASKGKGRDRCCGDVENAGVFMEPVGPNILFTSDPPHRPATASTDGLRSGAGTGAARPGGAGAGEGGGGGSFKSPVRGGGSWLEANDDSSAIGSGVGLAEQPHESAREWIMLGKPVLEEEFSDAAVRSTSRRGVGAVPPPQAMDTGVGDSITPRGRNSRDWKEERGAIAPTPPPSREPPERKAVQQQQQQQQRQKQQHQQQHLQQREEDPTAGGSVDPLSWLSNNINSIMKVGSHSCEQTMDGKAPVDEAGAMKNQQAVGADESLNTTANSVEAKEEPDPESFLTTHLWNAPRDKVICRPESISCHSHHSL